MISFFSQAGVEEHYAPGAGPWEQIELDSAAKTVSALLIGVLVTSLGISKLRHPGLFGNQFQRLSKTSQL